MGRGTGRARDLCRVGIEFAVPTEQQDAQDRRIAELADQQDRRIAELSEQIRHLVESQTAAQTVPLWDRLRGVFWVAARGDQGHQPRTVQSRSKHRDVATAALRVGG